MLSLTDSYCVGLAELPYAGLNRYANEEVENMPQCTDILAVYAEVR